MKKYLLIVAILLASCQEKPEPRIVLIWHNANGRTCTYIYEYNNGVRNYIEDTCGKYKIGDILK